MYMYNMLFDLIKSFAEWNINTSWKLGILEIALLVTKWWEV